MNYQSRTNEILEKWKNESIKKGYSKFCYDGLIYKGEIYNTLGNDQKTCWMRRPGKEEELWACAPKRIMILNKDLPNENDEDIREWIFRQHERNITLPIYRNIALWVYGLLHVDENGRTPHFENINETSIYSPFFDMAPVAYVNCKKESGGSFIHNSDLTKHLTIFGEFLKEQILILDPDIIICGGGQSAIKNFISEMVFPHLMKINTWMYFDKNNNKLVIDSYHPSYWSIKPKDLYTTMMNKYEEFLEKNPEFLKSCRDFSCVNQLR